MQIAETLILFVSLSHSYPAHSRRILQLLLCVLLIFGTIQKKLSFHILFIPRCSRVLPTNLYFYGGLKQVYEKRALYTPKISY